MAAAASGDASSEGANDDAGQGAWAGCVGPPGRAGRDAWVPLGGLRAAAPGRAGEASWVRTPGGAASVTSDANS